METPKVIDESDTVKDFRKTINTFFIGLIAVFIGWCATEFVKLRDDMTEYKLSFKFMTKTVETLEMIAKTKSFTKDDYSKQVLPVFEQVEENTKSIKTNKDDIEKLMLRIDEVQKNLND